MWPNFMVKNELEWPRQRVIPALDLDSQEIKRTVHSSHSMQMSLGCWIPSSKVSPGALGYSELQPGYSQSRAFSCIIRWSLFECTIPASEESRGRDREISSRQAFSAEILALERGEQIKDRFLRSLKPVMRAGLLRVCGGLSKSAVPEDFKSPIILPSRSHVATLVISHIHKTIGHTGSEYVLSASREKYWTQTDGRQRTDGRRIKFRFHELC